MVPDLTPLQYATGVVGGVLVGFTLGLVGGGGSILATPLLVYAVGVGDPHVAIGTGACAVAANAGWNLVGHARRGRVRWSCAAFFAGAGVAGALVGSSLGKLMDGGRLLALFALLMLAIAASMLRGRDTVEVQRGLDGRVAVRLLASGGMTGALSGFFGIGGGFLIVPGLIASTRMPILNAVGTSLIAVAAFGCTTALNYAVAGWVDWRLALALFAGGVLGGSLGTRAAAALSLRDGLLDRVFAAIVVTVAIYMLARSLPLSA